MPDPKFVKPWHGIPREKIKWHPIVDEDACIGCGTCVTGCGRLVYRYDYEKKKAVVADPLSCMVGCVTCANTCPTKAINFPSLDEISSLLSKPDVHHAIEDELLTRKEQLQWKDLIPHCDRIVNMVIDKIHKVGKDILIVNLVPKNKQTGDCFCQFIPGQYVEVQIPDSDWMSRAYSIGNSPREDGSIELQIHRVQGGRFSSWAFEKMKSGDVISVRGPLGSFTFGSDINTSVLFVAGGTGFAPIKSIMEQLFKIFNDRTVTLVWGAHDSNGFYELDVIEEWLSANQNFQCFLATSNVLQGFIYPAKCKLLNKSLSNAISDIAIPTPQNYDAYVAGPPSMMTSIVGSMLKKGMLRERIKIDSFGS